jgi:hypothetical protein
MFEALDQNRDKVIDVKEADRSAQVKPQRSRELTRLCS